MRGPRDLSREVSGAEAVKSLRSMRWSGIAAGAFVAFASITISFFVGDGVGPWLLGGGIAVATIAVGWQLFGTWRVGHTTD